MATRQYIGARYVPKFYENSDNTSEWRSGVIYEPLTIVTYNGNSYTSKKPVPAEVGNPSSNPTYWAATGLYNAQVEEIRERMEEINDDLNDRIDEIQGDIDEMEQTECVWIGDSYTQANSLGDDQDKRFATLVSQRLGLTEHNYASGGSDFISGGSTGENYLTQLNNAISEMTDAQKRATKYLFVMGTRNMPYNNPNATLSNYYNAINNFFIAAHAAFPYTELIFVPMLWDAQPFIQSYRTCLQWCEQCALSLTSPVTTFFNAYLWLMGRYGDLLADGVHPNVGGHNLIATHVYNLVKGSELPPPTIFTQLNPSDNVSGTCDILVEHGKTARIRFSFTLSASKSNGEQIFAEMGLGNNYGFITNNAWIAQVVSNSGSSGAVQVTNYYTQGQIKFGVKCVGSLAAGTYNGEITLYNGMNF